MEIKIFENAEFGQIRTMLMPDGQVGFVGKDVATVLGYVNPRKALQDHVEKEDKMDGVTIRDSIGREQKPTIINESGLYALILSSKMPKAREFKHWVTSVVLPQIRKTGGYIPLSGCSSGSSGSSGSNGSIDDDNAIMARALLIAQKTIELKNSLIEAQRPKVIFAEAITASDSDILIRDLAKLLTQNGCPIGQNRLFQWLRNHGYIFRQGTRPIQRYVEMGLFSTSVTLVETPRGQMECLTTKVTTKGQQYFLDGFLSGKFTL